MLNDHLLNLMTLAGETVDNYALISFRGRETISQPFDYTIEVVTDEQPDLTDWIGKLAEFSLSPGSGEPRVFAGRIYGALGSIIQGRLRIEVHVGPAYLAVTYSRATHFVQDQTSLDIFAAMTGDVTGLTTSVNVTPAPNPRGYVARIDESEIDFLARLLAQDGIFYFFVYNREGGGVYRHKMIISNQTSAYIDLDSSPVPFRSDAPLGSILTLDHHVRAGPGSYKHMSVNPNQLDTPFISNEDSSLSWGAVYGHEDETIGYEAFAEGDLAVRQTANDQSLDHTRDGWSGSSGEHSLFPGGRFEIDGDDLMPSGKLVLTSVDHAAYDPSLLGTNETPTYSNSFTAIDATDIYRPRVGEPRRVAPGPVVGVVDDTQSETGKPVIDNQSRIPVKIIGAREYDDDALPKFVWLPVQQQWAHSTHGAQFFPRIGTRVIVDFLYGNPDLPFVSGTVYTPSQPYPFDPTSTPTQSGWRSVTEGNGSITQEFHFEDKDGSEEIYLYTGRDYRREIDEDELATIKRDQTVAITRDQTLTVERDQKETIEGNATTLILKDQTVTVAQAAKFESFQEIEIVVGVCSIKLSTSGIEIKAPQIKVNADATLEMVSSGEAKLEGMMLEVTGDATTTIKGGVVMIN
jgi:type VI secretion system secreted protein VgrG